MWDSSVTKRSEEAPVYRPRKGWVTGLREAIRTVEILALIAYVAIFAISRTDGFASLVARKIERNLGGAVRIGKTRLTPGLDLVLEKVQFRSPNETGKDFADVAEIRMNLRWTGVSALPRPDSLQCRDPVLHIDLDESGKTVCPAGADVTLRFQAWGWPVPEIHSQSATGAAAFWQTLDLPVRLQNGTVVWHEADGGTWRIEGVRGEIRPVHFDRKTIRCVELEAARARSANGPIPAPAPLWLIQEAGRPDTFLRLSVPTRSGSL